MVAAAVLLEPGAEGLSGARDSKLLSAARREALFAAIRAGAVAVSLAWAYPRRIEETNILEATLAAMRRAVSRLPPADLVLVDGPRRIPGLRRPQLALVGGDGLSLAVACASIMAKVVRDRWMGFLERRYPGYGLARHKGYGTALHLERLSLLGPSPAHRRSYAPVRDLLSPEVKPPA